MSQFLLFQMDGEQHQQQQHFSQTGSSFLSSSSLSSSDGSHNESGCISPPQNVSQLQGMGIGPQFQTSPPLDGGIQQFSFTSSRERSAGNGLSHSTASGNGSSLFSAGGSVPYISLTPSLTSPPQKRLQPTAYSPMLQMSTSETSSPLIGSLGGSRSSPGQLPLSFGNSPLATMSSFEPLRDPEARRNTFDSPLFFQSQQQQQQQQQSGLYLGNRDFMFMGGQSQQSKLGLMGSNDAPLPVQIQVKQSSLPQLMPQHFSNSSMEHSFSGSSTSTSAVRQSFGVGSSTQYVADTPPFLSTFSSSVSAPATSIQTKLESPSQHPSEDEHKSVDGVGSPIVKTQSEIITVTNGSSPSSSSSSGQLSPYGSSMMYSPPNVKAEVAPQRRHKLHVQPPQHGNDGSSSSTSSSQHPASSTFVSVQQLFRTKPCRFFFEKGTCLKGDRCNFSHDPVFAAQYAEAHAKELGTLVGTNTTTSSSSATATAANSESQKPDRGSNNSMASGSMGQDSTVLNGLSTSTSAANSVNVTSDTTNSAGGAAKVAMYRVNGSSGITIYRNAPQSDTAASADESPSNIPETTPAASTQAASSAPTPTSRPFMNQGFGQQRYSRRGKRRNGPTGNYNSRYGGTYHEEDPANASNPSTSLASLSEFPPLN